LSIESIPDSLAGIAAVASALLPEKFLILHWDDTGRGFMMSNRALPRKIVKRIWNDEQEQCVIRGRRLSWDDPGGKADSL
jgi:hypothetical protein